jgi:hypothetical protein
MPNGLLAIDLSRDGKIRHALPERVGLNVTSGYALHCPYPRTGNQLAGWIHEAWTRRSTYASLIDNPRARRHRNSVCQ